MSWMFRSRYTLTVDNVETHERLSSGFMVSKSNVKVLLSTTFTDEAVSLKVVFFQRHPIFFERTSTLVTTQEKHGSDVKAAGWYNLGQCLCSDVVPAYHVYSKCI